MVGVLFDSDEPDVLLQPFLAGCRVATYADLMTTALVKEFGPRLIVIDRGHGDPLGLASVVDIEPGLYSPTAGVAKVKQFITERRPGPAVYHDRSEWAAVNQLLAGVPVRHWVSTLDGTSSPGGVRPAAVQILGAAQLGFHADLSIVWDDTWRPVPDTIETPELVKLKQLTSAADMPLRQLIAYIAGL